MDAAGEPNPEHVAALMKALGFESPGAEASVAEWDAKQRYKKQTYLQLQLPPSAVRFVDTVKGLLEAASALEAGGAMDILRLDCEWDALEATERP